MGLDICGKTGTAQNPQGKDNSAFICFAPKDNPKIAVAVYVENAGFGAQFAAPIASMIVEQYLNGEMKRAPLLKKMRSAFLVKPFTPDTARASTKPLLEINSTLLPASDSMKKLQQTQPNAPRVIITPQAILNQPVAKPTPVVPTKPTPTTPSTPTTPVTPPAAVPQEPKLTEPPKVE